MVNDAPKKANSTCRKSRDDNAGGEVAAKNHNSKTRMPGYGGCETKQE